MYRSKHVVGWELAIRVFPVGVRDLVHLIVGVRLLFVQLIWTCPCSVVFRDEV